jgi:hypothetical protein
MSRRFKGRHFKVKADPKARPAAPVVLDDSNSFKPFAQPDMRHPKQLQGRAYVVAGSSTARSSAPPAIVKPPASSSPAPVDPIGLGGEPPLSL